MPPRTPALRSTATARGPPPSREAGRATGAAPAPLPHRPPQVPGAGRIGAADRPGRLPAPTAAASDPGRRRRRLERVAGPGRGAADALETPPCGNPAWGLCVLSNYLFVEKKGGERKKRSHMSGLYVCEEKQQKEGK